jgi:FKBP-type peptidyl-prolyl cis-trans isomerase
MRAMRIAYLARALIAGSLSLAFSGCAQSISDAKNDTSDEKVTTTSSGLKYVDLKEGTGAVAQTGKYVEVNYTGWLKTGKKFDSSYDRKKPYSFKLGAGMVIKGWDEGVVGMKVGGQRKLLIPPELAYGSEGRGMVIPPNAPLVFEVELLKVD